MRRGMLVFAAGSLSMAVVGAVLVGSAAGGSSAVPPLRAYGFTARHPATGPIPHVTRARTVRFRLHTDTLATIDNDPVGTSQGDRVVVEGHLLTHRGTQGAGRLEVDETFTGVGPNTMRVQLLVTAMTAAGQIVSAGAVTFGQNTTLFRAAIIGGTGKYRNARGQVVIQPGNGNTTRLTYLLLP